ncbi:hypothetical protein JXD38_07065 [candidate division WOR-3 bacterium]|nr:hypothetical protein [candidate division WOR-3 bacterium]
MSVMGYRVLAFATAVFAVLALHCKSGNQAPVVDSFSAPDSVYPGTDHVVSCTATDPENDPVMISWECTGGKLTPDTGSSVTWRSPDSAGTVTVTVEAKDTHNGVGTDHKDVVVSTAANRPPVISGITGADTVESGGSTDLACAASDPDGDTLTYTWTCNTGGLSSQSGPSVTWYAPDSAASAVVTVVVSDGQLADTATKSVVVKVKPNEAPIIDSISGPASLPANGSTTLTCYAHDPDGDSLTYAWTCERGHVTPPTGATVTWTAPDTSGNVIITATVRDAHNANDQRTKTINVTKVTTTWIDTMVSVPAASAKAWYGTMKIGYRVWGSFSVEQKATTALDINFYVFDSTNYYKWVNNQSATGVVVVNRSSGTSYSGTIPKTCRYYVVLDNTYSILTPKVVTFNTKLTSP